MNFLAHIYLSGENELLKIGNFMADGVRGKEYTKFDLEIQKGILLHRFIDSFTDSHPVYRKSKHRLHENYGHYSGVIMDIFYDHFLAKNWLNYHSTPLNRYAEKFYESLQNNYSLLTTRTQKMLPYMIANNWLVSYSTLSGMEMILFQMDYRTQHRVNMPKAIHQLKEFYLLFEEEFTIFFDILINECKIKLINI
ncbi:acyl carrier protein phosphodiesterase [Flavobacterium oreochromis]|uniref:ACP phosphodiesterase n=2 Tax=Flavobacterium TaxID=237 RepID=A0A246G9A4_9FLAO|nr:acyl carrier protein phosphodiesterase [Flavobacterium oreochromis]OWP76019.1 ACP phosphodiesterase [Flavobacterium oreochromis]OWP77759.1 ACP phosphodiesterase [Flavobacterium oreochromis]POR21383.1 ACP phosphodiesterase [Flavobacterium columnare]QYS85757.1 acyl carrier protein phosphodiesterase [Flavobacterium oreochromis]